MSWTRCWKMLPTTTKRRCVLTRLQHQNQSCIKNPCSSIYLYTPGVYIYYFVGESWMQSNCEAAGQHRFAGILILFLKKGARACVRACEETFSSHPSQLLSSAHILISTSLRRSPCDAGEGGLPSCAYSRDESSSRKARVWRNNQYYRKRVRHFVLSI